ncbi:hypothetical protein B7P43_G05996 [Cryptotermes secundus]|uniref:Single domain-containing protein n=1 Tax=Cryptotermes secundus TaxID=105785 RepID=A0A2J7QA53_9NEOP|nr:uncharacterized protein LOC111868842 [Cryptotermes secundus]PNF25471.1 hypothetical protein B7P43_G05996 [Cryptotermes secundus]
MLIALALSTAVLTLAGCTSGAVYREILPERQEAPGKCFVELSAGESYYKENECVKYTCQPSSRVGYVELVGSTCSMRIISFPGCEDKPENLTLKYPECCPSTCSSSHEMNLW